jgi:hypothetical protein
MPESKAEKFIVKCDEGYLWFLAMSVQRKGTTFVGP